MDAKSPRDLSSSIRNAASSLRSGGVIVYPTETFYGVGAALARPDALARIVAIKGRPDGKPMPVIAGSEEDARSLWAEVPALAAKLMKRFWPGPLTLVLPARPGLPFEVAPQGEIGIRVSSHPVARELAQLAGPIVATSANLSGGREGRWVNDLEPSLLAAVDAIVDAGETPGGRPSTVVRVTSAGLSVLREGAIPSAELGAS